LLFTVRELDATEGAIGKTLTVQERTPWMTLFSMAALAISRDFINTLGRLILAYKQAKSATVLPGVDRLERSIATCEALLALMQTATHPAADRSRYLLGVRLATMRLQLKDLLADGTGN